MAIQALICAAPARPEPADYNPAVRPDPAGTPTEVSVAALVIDLADIDDVKQEFTIDVYVIVRWRDGRLAADSELDEERTLPLASVWHPALGALNRRGASIMLPEVVFIDPDGNVEYSQRYFGQIGSPLDLQEFPADTQTLEVRMLSYRYGPDELVVGSRGAQRLERMSVSGWRVGQPRLEPSLLDLPEVTRAGTSLQVEVERETGYYVLTMVMPLLLITLMAWAVFWIDPSLLPSQVGIATASVFTLIAFRFSLSLRLPEVSYLTTADWFVLTATLLVFGALGETVYAGRLAKLGREDAARRVDYHSRWIYLVALTTLCLLTLS